MSESPNHACDSARSQDAACAGAVYLVGAGPGAPGLLTLRGRRLLESADVVVFDALVNPALLRYARPGARFIDAGKRAGLHRMKQEDTNALLVELARAGKRVVRLKGGDPCVFGRGAEEAAELRAAGAPCEIVPGVTSAFAAPAYAGVSPTIRRVASSIHIFTAQGAADRDSEVIEWARAAQMGGTLIFMMGFGRIGEIAAQLIAHGIDPATPAAVVQWGTTPSQRQAFSRLDRLEAAATEAGLGSPAVIAIGQAAAEEQRVPWMDALPLFGLSVAFTRDERRATPWLEACEDLGARVFDFPLVATEPSDPGAEGRRAFERLGEYDWIVFANSLGVETFFDWLSANGADARRLAGVKIAAVGPETAETLLARGIRVDLLPQEKSQEGLARELAPREGMRVLLPGSPLSRPSVERAVAEAGGQADRLRLYETRPVETSRDELIAELERGGIDALVFATPMAARVLLDALAPERARRLLAAPSIVCIGAQSAAAFEAAGRPADWILSEPTLEALIEALRAIRQTMRERQP